MIFRDHYAKTTMLNTKRKGKMMTDKPHNPQAFPEWILNRDIKSHAFLENKDGMTLRDYFAGQALAGLTLHQDAYNWGEHGISFRAYDVADAMMKEREE